MRQHRIDAVIHPVDIDGKHPIPMFLADLGDQTIMGDSGVVDQDVGGKIMKRRPNSLLVRHIAANRLRAGLSRHGLCRLVIFLIEEPHAVSLSGKHPNRLRPDPPTPAGDDDVHSKLLCNA